MSKGAAIILLGLFTVFLPFTGFPEGFKTVLAIIFGLLTMALGFLVKQEREWLIRDIRGKRSADTYAENSPKRSAFTE